jgi:4-aminobutyrate aminotransferase-like enzyme/Ser/Thr protein kinase RdoA (MazF antagonist)
MEFVLRDWAMESVGQNRPRFSEQQASALALDLFGVEGTAHALPSERDQNFHIRPDAGGGYVLKLSSAAEQAAVLELQNQVLGVLAQQDPELPCPRVCAATCGREVIAVPGPEGGTHWVRLLSYIPGVPLATVRPQRPELLRRIGGLFGRLDRALEGFSHAAAHRPLVWSIKDAGSVIGRCQGFIRDHDRLALIGRFVERFDSDVLPLWPHLRTSVIHNDGNDYNILISPLHRGAPNPQTREITGLLDFGDIVYSCTAAEPAIAAAYALFGKADPLAAAASVIGGYHAEYPLTEPEFQALFPLICTRLATSVALSAYQRSQEPDNAYLSISERDAWAALGKLAGIHPRLAHYTFRAACGLPPCPRTAKVVRWLRDNKDGFSPVVGADAAGGIVLDLSVASPLVSGPPTDSQSGSGVLEGERCRAATEVLFGQMKAAGAAVGIGRYNEARMLYVSDAYRTESDEMPEGRTVHLGVDLFMQPASPVFAPLDGAVHTFQDNAQTLDYGPTIILRHEAGDGGCTFYTLYGHLSRQSLAGLVPGMAIRKGERIAALGTSAENGGWPPHLHFEIITDLLDRDGEFPGLAAASSRGVWLSLCPDPNLILKLPPDDLRHSLASEEILSRRLRLLGPNLSLSYREPLHLVRGYLQYMYDECGRAYLDAVNNVPHVGHCHPEVVRAARQQTGVLNTNTRYLHENIVRYAERLTATMPPRLSVCYFVCSGSEANDLALRLARAFARQRDTIVVDGAYHGNLTSLIEISPYKFDGPGGSGCSPWVHKVPTPDVYRGLYRGGLANAGAKYALHVQEAIDRIHAQGRGVAAFIAESLLSCAGQIVLPDGYLDEAYRRVRAAGGVCVADEVQTGFGRVGSHVWGFQTQGVVPDIVTLGKPIGNGHPLGAVVTTPEIAVAFDNGMEYFNTYGGNPVSCAVGLAVLDVIEREKLQWNALETGRRLKHGLTKLLDTHDLIGDVRGEGLFVGVELILNRGTLEPAGAHASYVAERMKDHGILVSTDGPFHNVLKIKPPLVFNADDADRLVTTLDRILSEDYLSGADPAGPHR